MALTKPRITLMVVLTAAGGMWLAPGDPPVHVVWVMLVTTAGVVAAANSLNCWLERDSDRLMVRTKSRPLPDGRLQPSWALASGLVLGGISVPLLAIGVNLLTAALGALALVSYVAVYTPMKPRSPMALFVGAIPGALPPLMGWTAATGSLDLPGWVLFGILFFWQIPHFVAISIVRQSDYDRAGLQVLPSARGLVRAKICAVIYTFALGVTSVMLYPLGIAGTTYAVSALVLGLAFACVALVGLHPRAGERWARQLFVASLLYLTALFIALIVDAL